MLLFNLLSAIMARHYESNIRNHAKRIRGEIADCYNDGMTQFSSAICNWRMLVFPCTIGKYLEYRPFSSYGHIHMRFRRQHGQRNSLLHFLNKPDTIRIPAFFVKRIFLSSRPPARPLIFVMVYIYIYCIQCVSRVILMTDFF